MAQIKSISIKIRAIIIGVMLLLSVGGLFASSFKLGTSSQQSVTELSRSLKSSLGEVLFLQQRLLEAKIAVIQVQQFLSDVSATRGLNGLDDGFKLAAKNEKVFNNNIKSAIAVATELKIPDMVAKLDRARELFPNYYSKGRQMAEVYVREGPEAGNKMMGDFDKAADQLTESLEAVLDSMNDYRDAADREANHKVAESQKTLDEMIKYVSILGVLGTLVTFYLLFLLSRIVRGIIRAATCIDLAARGQLNDRILNITGTDELSKLSHNVNHLLDVTEVFLKESEASMNAAAERRYYRRIFGDGMPGLFKKSATRIGEILGIMQLRDESFEKGLKNMTDLFDRNITSFLVNLVQSANMLNSISEDLIKLSSTNLSQSNNLADAASISSSSVGVVASTTEELSASIREINMQISRSTEISTGAVAKSNEATETIKQLQESAKKIGDIVDFINTIAQQTNLLALNATIEAARAGDAGKGFAVVAAEVKGLANKTSAATAEISTYVTGVLNAINSTVKIIDDIGGTINNISESSSSVASAMEEQTSAIGEILRSMQNASESVRRTQDVTITISETAKQSEAMAKALGDASTDLSKKSGEITGELETFLSNLKTQ